MDWCDGGDDEGVLEDDGCAKSPDPFSSHNSCKGQFLVSFKLIFPLAMKWVSESKLARNNVSRPKEGAGPN